MVKVVERAADPGVTPAGVIAGHIQNQFLNLSDSFGAPWFSRGAAIVLFGDELSIPSKQRIRRDDSPKCEESLSADYLGLACQTSTLAVSKQDAIATDLLAKHSNLGLQVFNDFLLRAVNPPGEHQHQKLDVSRVHRAGLKLIRSVCARPRIAIAGAYKLLN